MQDTTLHGILIDVGLPVNHRNNRFNCRALLLNGKLLMLRPKLFLANDGNYREMRHFIPWQRTGHTEEYYLPEMIRKLNGTTKVVIGDCVLSTSDTCLGFETCEELFLYETPMYELHVRYTLTSYTNI
jgi:NAD+ synthase (glutamine-hydrolysing)